jgi:uncharacterized protein
MKLELEHSAGGHRIDGYDARGIRIGGKVHTGTVLISSDRIVTDYPLHSIDGLDPEMVQSLIALAPELLLLGTGARQHFPSPGLLAPLLARGIGVEVMTTAAACRVYGILAGEGRCVAALLLPPDAG